MSPEQAESDEVSPQSDVWSLGVVLYEMLTGQLPFKGGTPVAVLYQILHEDPEPLENLRPGVTPAASRIVARALGKELDHRYLGMGELLGEIHSAKEFPSHGGGPPALEKETEASPGELSVTPPPFLTPEAESWRGEVILPFVGREAELEVLGGWLGEALAGRGRVGFITGDAGSGKSALVREFCRRASAGNYELIVATGNCNAHTGVGDPFRPFREVLAQLTGDVEAQWAAGSISAEHATRLWSLFPASITAISGQGPDLVGTFIPEAGLFARAEAHRSFSEKQLAQLQTLKERQSEPGSLQQVDLFEQYVRVVRAVANQKPLLLVVDDLHWADTGSIGLLFELGKHLSGSRVLIVGLYRPAEVAVGRDGNRHPLEPVVNELGGTFGDVLVEFNSEADRDFLEALIDAEPNHLDAGFREAFFAQTRGHALFSAELLSSLKLTGLLVRDEDDYWEEGKGNIDWTHLPARVDAVIGERVGRLTPDLQKILSVASIQGELFTLEVVADVQGCDPTDLLGPVNRGLERRHQLVVAEGIRRVGGQRISTYRFRHILFQRHMYDELNEVERVYLHEQTGEALEHLFGSHSDEVALPLAQHFQEAGLADRAADYFITAGEQAQHTGSSLEAVTHLRSALEAVLSLPPSTARDRIELDVQTRLGWALLVVGAPGSVEAFSQARELARAVGKGPELFWTVSGLFSVLHWQGDHRWTKELAEECLVLARKENDPALLGPAFEAVGRNALWRGDLRKSKECYEALLSSDYDPWKHTDQRYFQGGELGSLARGMIGWALWKLGYSDQALSRCKEGVAFAQEVQNPVSLTFALAYMMFVCQLRREVRATQEWAAALRVAAAEAGTAGLWEGSLLISEGWCRLNQGQVNDGIRTIKAGWADTKSKGLFVVNPWCMRVLTDCLRSKGDAEGGLGLLAEYQAATETIDDFLYDSDLLQIRGELLLTAGEPKPLEAELAFREAVGIARCQEAKSFELRATTSLARLLRDTGRVAEAREVLGEIYGWFTEGFDTLDLIEAKELLIELGGSP